MNMFIEKDVLVQSRNCEYGVSVSRKYCLVCCVLLLFIVHVYCQATTLLTMDKYSMQDVQNIHNTCFKLNSLQLNALMTNYHCAPDEPYIPPVRHHRIHRL